MLTVGESKTTPKKIGVWGREQLAATEAMEPRKGGQELLAGELSLGLTKENTTRTPNPAQPASPRTPTEESTSFFAGSLTIEAMMCQTAWFQAQPPAV